MPGFKIRRASARDIDVLVEHRRRMFADISPKIEQGDVATDPYRIWAKEMMSRRLYHGYVVSDQLGRVAASGCVWLREVQPHHGLPASMVPYLISMYTVPEFRRNGLASMIVKEAMRWAKRQGYESMFLHASIAGRKVYSQLGWKRTWEMEVDLESAGRSTFAEIQ